MKIRGVQPFYLVAMLLVLVATGAVRAESILEITSAQRSALGIEFAPVEATPWVSRPPLPARVLIPNERASIVSARTDGIVLSLAVAVGDAVTAGQVVAKIESPSFVLLQREFLDALTERDLASATFERERQLAEEGIVAGRRAAESQARLHEARSLVEERRQALLLVGMNETAVEALGRSRRMQSTLEIRSAVDGFLLEQWAHVGERLEAGSPLYRIGRLDRLHVEVHVPVDLARRIREGSGFHLADADATGRVIAVGRDVHALDQGVLVRGLVEQGHEALRPGQFVRVMFQTQDIDDAAFEVPNTALIRIGERAFVFRRVLDGLEPVLVDILGGSGQRATLSGPLSTGDVLVMRGTAALKAHWLSQGGPD